MRSLIAERPNMVPTGVGHSGLAIDLSVLNDAHEMDDHASGEDSDALPKNGPNELHLYIPNDNGSCSDSGPPAISTVMTGSSSDWDNWHKELAADDNNDDLEQLETSNNTAEPAKESAVKHRLTRSDDKILASTKSKNVEGRTSAKAGASKHAEKVRPAPTKKSHLDDLSGAAIAEETTC